MLGPAEATRFLQAARSGACYVLWAVLLYGGLRPTEALVFRWTDVDGDKLRVQRGLIRNKGGGWTLDEPKTGRRRRTVTLPSPAVEALTAHRVNRPTDGLPRVRRGRITVSSVREAGEPLFLRKPDPAAL